MATLEEEICKAPPGKLQIVHIDPRDYWPTRIREPMTRQEVKDALSKMLWAEREVMVVFDDKGEVVSL
ncbi:MAG TPA: hypothetical protein VJG64_03895 [Candidatus Paceibacterota bacterium]